MRLSCQFALYPLGVEDIGPAIDAAVAAFTTRGIDVRTGPMSSVATGSPAAVFAALAQIFADAEGPTVLVVTVSNACPTEGSS